MTDTNDERPLAAGAPIAPTAPIRSVDPAPCPVTQPVRRDNARVGAITGAALAVVTGAAITFAASPAVSPSQNTGSAITTEAEASSSPAASDAPDASTEPGATTKPGDTGDKSGGKSEKPWGRGPGFGFGGPGFGIRGAHVGGITVTANDGSSLSLETDNGWTRTITVADDTEITKAGDAITLDQIAVGDSIGLREQRNDDGTWTVTAIVVIQPVVAGTVTAVDGDSITVEERDGTSRGINVDADTEYLVRGDETPALSDIEVGDVVIAEGTLNDDESLDADRVAAGGPGREFRGGPGHRHGWPGGPRPGDEPQEEPSTEPATDS